MSREPADRNVCPTAASDPPTAGGQAGPGAAGTDGSTFARIRHLVSGIRYPNSIFHPPPSILASFLLLLLAFSAHATVRYVDASSASPTPPYTNWATAARVIQDAVDAAAPGDEIVVTNGIYATGGRAVYGTMTNRVAVDKLLSVHSVNGPEFTVIQGYQVPGATNGDGAIRCVYLMNGARLSGFTLTNGATRSDGDWEREWCGGGLWCERTAVASNCVLFGNSASGKGGGAYSGTLNNCMLTGNSAPIGGGAADCTLNNCTVTGNSAYFYGGGARSCRLNNCIVYFNTASSGSDPNYNDSYSTLNYCCTTPLPRSGVGNISLDPQLASASHLGTASPCRGAGSPTYASGADIDGEAWGAPPSIGCDEHLTGAVTGPLNVRLTVAFTNVATDFLVDFTAFIEGRTSASVWGFGDGVVVSNRPYATHAWTTPGDYAVTLRAFNESHPDGVNATLMVHVVEAVHHVAILSTNPLPPYASWATAATNIQDAVEAARVPGASVLVSNGVYATGGRAVVGTMTNRVAVDKPLTVRSVNGPQFTAIQGYQLPGTTNGDGAIRCVYLANGTSLSGFTLTNGATRSEGDWQREQCGGGVWCESVTAVVSNCVLAGNSALINGGGAYGGTLNNCTLTGNSASQGGGGVAGSWLDGCTLTGNSADEGGGANGATLNNCALTGNSAQEGGGAYQDTLNNCTLTGNSAREGGGAYSSTLNNCSLTGNSGGGAAGGTLNNCILYYNTARSGAVANYYGSALNFCCTTPLPPAGLGNLSLEPQLASASHLSIASPCIGAGFSAYASGADIDGEAWANPPSIGCDEYWPGTVTGALSVAVAAAWTNVAVGFAVDFRALIDGRASASRWDFGDGTVVSNQPYASHAWTEPGDYTLILRAYNESHPIGVSATLAVRVQQEAHYVAAGNAQPVAPYTSWATAATNIQDALDVATAPGALVLVANGTYATGGRAVGTNLLVNRVAVDKPLTLRSVNGPQFTVIQGYQVPGTTNGDGAIRCVYLANGAMLSGFTLANGATLKWPEAAEESEQNGGGLWCGSFTAVVSNCVLVGNSAYLLGGGAFGGTLNNCTLTGNSVFYYGGGASDCTLNNCSLTGNWAWQGGGASGGTLNNCTLTGNLASGGDVGIGMIPDGGGGGAYGSTLNNCTLAGNSALVDGGGAYGGTLNNCTLAGNSAVFNGGGAYGSTLNNCTLAGNSAAWGGGAVAGSSHDGCSLNNCTLTDNSAEYGGGVAGVDTWWGPIGPALANCIVYFNTAEQGENYDSLSALNYCCTTPDPGGIGNITVDPQLASATYLSAGSPCRGAGSAAYANGTDIDGEPWANPPSIGCDEYHAGALTGPLSVAVAATHTNVAVGFPVALAAFIEGRTSASVWGFGDGIVMSNRPYATQAWTTLGDYAVTLRAFNESHPDGVSATLMVHVVEAVHHVAIGSTNPQPPYASWATAATNIQDAVDMATVPGACVLVSNGTYATGGRAVGSDGLVNRVAVDKPLALRSVNGPQFTVIQGYQVPGTTNGDGAIRCVYLADGATLSGFTLTNGGTRTWREVSDYRERCGGGLWCESTNTVVSNCVLVANSAGLSGGGVCNGTVSHCTLTGNSAGEGGGAAGEPWGYPCILDNCTLTGNLAFLGGGAAGSTLDNCTLTGNSAEYSGGGAYVGRLNNCTLAGNSAGGQGGGVSGDDFANSPCTLNNCTLTGNSARWEGGGAAVSTLNNCIVCFNTAPAWANYSSDSTLNYCCTTPLPTGGRANVSLEPQLASASHLSASSPCRGAGNAAYSTGTDIDGESWATPPSMGCDEYHAGAATGSLSVRLAVAFTNVATGFPVEIAALIEGRTTASTWDFGHGVVVSNRPYTSHAWAAPGDYAVVLRAYNESNQGGVSAIVTVQVAAQPVHHVALASANPLAPYASWATAATNIQPEFRSSAIVGWGSPPRISDQTPSDG